jgi:hypothetical protein
VSQKHLVCSAPWSRGKTSGQNLLNLICSTGHF